MRRPVTVPRWFFWFSSAVLVAGGVTNIVLAVELARVS